MAAWDGVKEPLAAAMNGVKGEVITLNKRRGRPNALHGALDQARIDRATLDAMLGAMQDSFPMFRKYLRAKAKRLGQRPACRGGTCWRRSATASATIPGMRPASSSWRTLRPSAGGWLR